MEKSPGHEHEALSLEAELDRSYVSQIERAIGNPSLLVLERLANTLDCDVVDLLEAGTQASLD